LVYAGNGREVRLVMVAGKVLLREGVVQSADEATIRATAQEQAQALSQRVAADPVHQGMALLEPMARGYL
jgi:5-methylthioadenosine/S-adenosylhomocysteine deaminase